MIFDYPTFDKQDYKIPKWASPEMMADLARSKDIRDKKIHDMIILIGVGKYTQSQINRMLYLSRYASRRLRKKIVEKQEKYK